MAEKTDLKKQHRALFTAKTPPALIDAPTLPYLMVDGAGAPQDPAFRNAVDALYAVAYVFCPAKWWYGLRWKRWFSSES